MQHDWVGKVIHWQLCKRLKFDYANKWYTHKPVFIQENETHKILWDTDESPNLGQKTKPNIN